MPQPSRLEQANVLLSEEKYVEAVGVYDSALLMLPNHQKSASSYNNLGWALQKLGRLDEAIRAYENAVRLDPSSSLPRNNLEAARRAKGR